MTHHVFYVNGISIVAKGNNGGIINNEKILLSSINFQNQLFHAEKSIRGSSVNIILRM
jgi:hypothetical protein